jgi:hypothetical protein
MSAIPKDFGQAGANIAPNGAAGSPDLATAFREVADDFAGNVKVPAWFTALVVTTHVHIMAQAGWVLQVHATAGGAAGVKTVIATGAPSAGQVRVDYTAGVPTLTFAAADAITACSVTQIPYTAIKTTKA